MSLTQFISLNVTYQLRQYNYKYKGDSGFRGISFSRTFFKLPYNLLQLIEAKRLFVYVGTYTTFTPSIAFTSIPIQPDCRPCSKSYFRVLAGLLFGPQFRSFIRAGPMHLVYLTSIYKWDIYDLYNYTRPVQAIYNSYKSALALRVLFYFLCLLYIYSNPYLTRDTHYRLINILLLRYYYMSHIRITQLY